MKIGILGSGQLARMLVLAGYPLGLSFRTYSPEEHSPTDEICERIRGAYDDHSQLRIFAENVDVITYEFENVPLECIRFLSPIGKVSPSLRSLEVAQDRIKEKTYLRSLNIPTADFLGVDSLADAEQAAITLKLPFILKTRRFGYDGKGQATVRTIDEIPNAVSSLGGKDLIAEQFVAFTREVSVIGVRSKDGSVETYPLFANIHSRGILAKTEFPAPSVDEPITARASDYMKRLLLDLDYVGVCTLELFLCGDHIVANEIAPRVHNSGHVTIEGAETSQFESHIRAISDLPLGSCRAIGMTSMLNVIGIKPSFSELLALPGCHLHWYGKDPRPGRKVGHVTLTDPRSVTTAQALISNILE